MKTSSMERKAWWIIQSWVQWTHVIVHHPGSFHIYLPQYLARMARGFVGLPYWLFVSRVCFLAVVLPSCLFQLAFQRLWLCSAFSTFLIFYTPHFPHSAFSTLHIFHTPRFPHSSFSTLLIFYTPHSALRTPHSALRTPHSALRTPHSALRTPHSALRTPHSALRTPHSTNH